MRFQVTRERWRDEGANLFLLGADQGFIRAGAIKLRADAGF